MFSFRARAEKEIARHIDASGVVGLVIFYWFVLSMRMQVILDSSFARPGGAGRKESSGTGLPSVIHGLQMTVYQFPMGVCLRELKTKGKSPPSAA